MIHCKSFSALSLYFLLGKTVTLNGVEGINSETGKCDYTIRGCFERLSQIKWELKTHGGTQGVPGQLTIIIASIQPSRHPRHRDTSFFIPNYPNGQPDFFIPLKFIQVHFTKMTKANVC